MYDFIFITQLPSFYKVNLYNKIAEKASLKVIYIGKSSVERTPDFVSADCKFDYVFLREGNFEEGSVLQSILKLRQELKKTPYKKVVCSGWNLPEFIWVFLTVRKSKIMMVLESTVLESTLSGIKGFLKKLLIQRVGTVLASGNLHVKLLKAMNFSGEILITRGVGLINKPAVSLKERSYQKKFIFLGRLAPEKNLDVIISAFRDLPDYSLSIVGNGPLEGKLKSLAPENVTFIPHVPNEKIAEIFYAHDALILGSLRETWGLVVEESLYYGRPVIISKNCGAVELIEDGKNGFVFDPYSLESLKESLRKFNPENYQKMQTLISDEFIVKKDHRQVQVYLDQLK